MAPCPTCGVLNWDGRCPVCDGAKEAVRPAAKRKSRRPGPERSAAGERRSNELATALRDAERQRDFFRMELETTRRQRDTALEDLDRVSTANAELRRSIGARPTVNDTHYWRLALALFVAVISVLQQPFPSASIIPSAWASASAVLLARDARRGVSYSRAKFFIHRSLVYVLLFVAVAWWG
jgi:hypothetical protein